MKICGMVVLYGAQQDNLKYIRDYIDKVDIMLILDNSPINNQGIVEKVLYDYKGKYEYIFLGKNIGLCAALNRGVFKALKYGCDWSIVMDQDSSWASDIVDVYKQEIKKSSNVAVFAPVHVHERSNANRYDGTQIIPWAMTAGCCFDNYIFESLSGFKEELFVDGLDIDYCYRVQENGYRVLECGQAVINHNPAETHEFRIFGKTILKYGKASPLRYYMQIKSLTWIILRYRHFRDCKLWLAKWIKVVLFFENKKEYVKYMHNGIIDGMKLFRDYKYK